jgi:hypothetical protein
MYMVFMTEPSLPYQVLWWWQAPMIWTVKPLTIYFQANLECWCLPDLFLVAYNSSIHFVANVLFNHVIKYPGNIYNQCTSIKFWIRVYLIEYIRDFSFYLISLCRSGYYSRWPEPWPMTVHGHQFFLRARSSRTAANCLNRTTVMNKNKKP